MAQDLRELNDQEKLFCELFAMGEPPFAGNLAKCYEEAFAVRRGSDKRIKKLASDLFLDPAVKAYIEELLPDKNMEADMVKLFICENLKHIIAECSTKTYYDKKGRELSPAPLRSVAVAATKSLGEYYPIKELPSARVNIDNEEGPQGITFQVVVPEKKPDTGATPQKK